MEIKREKLEEYLSQFDAIELLYNMKYSATDENPKSSAQKLPSNLKGRLEEYQNNIYLGDLTKKGFSYIQENLKMVYDDETTKSAIKIFHDTEKHVLHKYLGIAALEKMFDEDYFNFEWDMHVGQNLKEHRMDYYRDHFIHQIRNMYMMHVLLDNYQFYDATKEILSNKNISKVSEYTSKKCHEFKDNFSRNARLHILMKDCAKQYSVSVKEYVEEYYYRYVIYASSIMAALFHDMGYPICHFLSVRQRISNYNPSMYMFTHNSFDSFDRIASSLGNSLLFTIVSIEEIKSRLEYKGKYDHGAYSAVAFLLQFYDNGLIYSLDIEKRVAIELAAIAIYNHTSSYLVLKFNDKQNYYQPVFSQNPVSFLLRLCDDLQEWDRMYFEISEAGDILFCDSCKTPLLKRYKKEHGEYERKAFYQCKCREKEEKEDIVRYDAKGYSFSKRKIYLISTADRIVMDIKEDALIFSIKYDYYKLLKMCRINNTYAKYRIKEYNDLKKLLYMQSLGSVSKKLSFYYIFIEYFMTANPLTIKIRILDEYCKKKKKCIETYAYRNQETVLRGIMEEADFTDISSTSGLCDVLEKNLLFYCSLIQSARTYQETGHKESGFLDRETEKIKALYINSSEDSFYIEIMENLIKDTIEQYGNMLSIEGFNVSDEVFFERYQSQFLSDEKIYNCVSKYCEKDNFFNLYKNEERYITYYSDLYFFWKLNSSL